MASVAGGQSFWANQFNAVNEAAKGNGLFYGGSVVVSGALTVYGQSGAFVAGGSYVNSSGAYVTLDAASASLARYDLIIGSNNGTISAVAGTGAAGSPVPPALPAASIPLAHVFIQSGATAVANSDITDLRAFGANNFALKKVSLSANGSAIIFSSLNFYPTDEIKIIVEGQLVASTEYLLYVNADATATNYQSVYSQTLYTGVASISSNTAAILGGGGIANQPYYIICNCGINGNYFTAQATMQHTVTDTHAYRVDGVSWKKDAGIGSITRIEFVASTGNNFASGTNAYLYVHPRHVIP